MPTLICRSLKHEVYKGALERYLSNIKKERYFGMCSSLLVSFINIVDEFETITLRSSIIDVLPEIKNQIPVNRYNHLFWFNPLDTQSRINTLNTCIRLTKPIKP